MRKIFSIILLLICTGVIAQIEFSANAPKTVAVGNQFRIAYSLNASGSDLRTPTLSGFRLLAGPSTSSSMSIVNGDVSRSQTYTYVLLAQKEGTFTIPPATIKVKGEVLQSNPITITVIGASKQEQANTENTSSQQIGGISNKDLFARLILDKSKVYLQEPVVLTLKLYTRESVRGFEGLDYPELSDFLALDIKKAEEVTFNIENINGVNYRTAVIKQSLLFPQRTGKLEIDEATLNMIIRVKSRQKRRSSFFDDFFESYQDVQKSIVTNTLDIEVSPFPTQSKPANFNNAVGEFSMSSSIDKQTLKANEPVTLKVTISGNGNIKLLPTPKINFPGDFEVYDPKVTNNLNTTETGVRGTRTFEYLVIPRFSGTFEIPSYSFSYFDTKAQAYKTLSTNTFQINVEKGTEEATQTLVSSFGNKEDLKFLGKDIRYIKTNTITLREKGNFFVGSLIFWLFYIIPVIIFLIIYLVYQKQLKENANVAKVKNKRANKIARKRLKTSEDLLKQNNKEAFYDEVSKAIWGYTSDKLNLSLAELNKETIKEVLRSHSVTEQTLEALIEILDTCEFAKYAPSAGSDAMSDLFKRTIDAISNLESQIK